jgi:hypothetical protein
MPTLDEEFDTQFVKDLGPDVEPIWLDPNGSVGPVKAFIKSYILSLMEDVKLEKKDNAKFYDGPSNLAYRVEVWQETAYNQALSDQEAKIAQALKAKGIV